MLLLKILGQDGSTQFQKKVFENLSYSAPDQKEKKIIINKEFVNTNLEKFAKSSDISRYVL